MSKTKRRKLTDRQQEVLDYIRGCIAEKYPPVLSDIAKHFNFSEKAAHDHLNAIEKKGYVERIPNAPRCIRIVESANTGMDATRVPETIIVEITPNIIVKADGFCEGEYLQVRKQPYGVKGDVVLVNANGCLMLYRLTSHLTDIIGKVVGHTIPLERNAQTPCS